ncbi:MAG: type II toxin-antitoxin system Phd/YefM family antitoxin [Pseudomonadota bacterium]
MTITTLSSREFNQDSGKAKKAAQEGPVIITDRGKPAHVLLSIDDYQKLCGQGQGVIGGSIVDLIALPDSGDIEFDPPRVGSLYRSAKLS